MKTYSLIEALKYISIYIPIDLTNLLGISHYRTFKSKRYKLTFKGIVYIVDLKDNTFYQLSTF